jgi:hypothetical protein
MNTKDRQMSALCELRSLAVESFNSLQDDRQSMRAMLRDLASSGQASTHFFDSSVNASAVEATMQRYSDVPVPPPSPTAQTHHQIPSPYFLPAPAPAPYFAPAAPAPSPGGPVGNFPPEFRGCLGCGGPDHVFRSCPSKHDPATKERFHRNFNAKFNCSPVSPSVAITTRLTGRPSTPLRICSRMLRNSITNLRPVVHPLSATPDHPSWGVAPVATRRPG